MKKLSYLIVLSLILGLVLTGCTLLSNIGQAPTTDQSGVTYLTKNGLFSDIVGLWHFDEISGTTAADSSGNGNDGTLINFVSPYGWVPGNFGNALSFDGLNDYVDCGAAVDDSITTGITLEAWIKPAFKQNGGIISSDITYSSNKGYDFFLWIAGSSYGRLYIDFGNGSTLGRTWWDITSPDWYNQWHHVAATWDGIMITLYVDGSKMAEVEYSGSYSDPGKNTFIGAIDTTTPPAYYFNRLIDEVRIWNFALSKDQLGKVYDFAGFFSPVENPPAGNMVKAGRAIPVKFSLNGDQGLDNIFVPGYPKSIPIKCDDTDPEGEIEVTATAGGSSLSYDAIDDQYTYVWKTDKVWAGTCRQLVVKLIDGTSHVANFTFK